MSVMASILFINIAMVTPNYRALYEQENAKCLAMEATSANLQNEKNVMAIALNKVRENSIDRDNTSAGIIIQLKNDVAKSMLTQADMKKDLAKAMAAAADLRIITAQQLAVFKETDADLKETTSEKDELASKIRGIEEALAASKTALIRAEMTEETLKQQISDKRTEITELLKKLDDYERGRGSTASNGGTAPVTTAPVGKIVASITTYGGRIATIDAGSTKGVVKGMMFHIYRGATLVGRLEISDVKADKAGGVVIEQRIDPQAGDKVTNTFQN